MEFLDRNEALIHEIGEKKKLFLGRNHGFGGSSRNFYLSGSYRSSILGQDLHLGVKTERYLKELDYEYMFVYELAVMNTIVTKFPHLAAELPVVYGLIRDTNDINLGYVMEDFGQGGRKKVRGLKAGQVEVPEEFLELLPETYYGDLIDTGWDVDGNRKLGDFNNFGFYLSDFEFRRIFDFGEIERQLGRFILKIDYKLESKPLEPYPHWLRPEQLKHFLEGIS